MNLWVGAAATGAGYIAKHWQNIFGDEEGVSGFVSERSYLDESQSSSLRDKNYPIKKLSQLKSDRGKGDQLDDIFAETSIRDGLMGREDTCSSALNDEQLVERSYELGAGLSGAHGDGTSEMGVSRPSRRSKNSLRSKRLHLPFIKPRNSSDSCLMAQMDENIQLEEYLRTPLSSPSVPSLRPFLVSDGKRLISKPRGAFMNGTKASNEVVGVPRLPIINPAGFLKQKLHGKNEMGKSYFRGNLMQFDTRTGCYSGKTLFCLGISIGILSTIVANEGELENLKESLKTRGNLVEDLQDELQMKDSLTVKVLVNDDDSQDINGIVSNNENVDVFSNQADIDVLMRYTDENAACLKKDDSISNIEAELEAELERMGLTMKGSTPRGEVTQDFDDLVSELVYGELQAETLRGRSSSETTLDRGSVSIPTPHPAKNGVSPRELSLRLHEVIQLRLEERIMELETELAKTQKHAHHLISLRNNYWNDVSVTGSSPSRYSPRVAESCDPTQRLVMNLTKDALDAYSESLEELNIQNPSKSQSSEKPLNWTARFSSGSNPWLTGNREEAIPISITGLPSSEDSPNDNYNSGDENDDDMLLIKQIVEKARQGSPAILRAKKTFVSSTRGH